MPDISGLAMHAEDDVARPDLRLIIQAAAWVGAVPENKGADHSGIPAAAGILTEPVLIHDVPRLRAGHLIFVCVRRIMCAP